MIFFATHPLKNAFFSFLLFLGLINLNLLNAAVPTVGDGDDDNMTTEIAYQETLQEVERLLGEYTERYNNTSSPVVKDQILEEMETFFLNSFHAILHYWYATRYDFNGITETPRKGFIACGYLISTIMKHAGFKVERIRLAQQPATYIVKTLCTPSTIESLNTYEQLHKYVLDQGEGVYIVGLDTHVGILIHYRGEIHFSHASPIVPQTVVQDKFNESLALTFSTIYVVGKVSNNKELFKKWMNKQRIPTVLK